METPLEVRQLDALKDWLREGSWTIREAACILAGVLPRERKGDQDRPFGAWLPGCEPWEEGRDSWANWVAQEIDHVETLLRENSGRWEGAKPANYLSFSLRHDISPPWLTAALADADSRALLPAEALAGQPASAGAMSGKEVASKGGTAKRDKDPQRAGFLPEVQRMHREGKSGAEIIRALAARYDTDAPPDSTVYAWLAEERDKLKTG